MDRELLFAAGLVQDNLAFAVGPDVILWIQTVPAADRAEDGYSNSRAAVPNAKPGRVVTPTAIRLFAIWRARRWEMVSRRIDSHG